MSVWDCGFLFLRLGFCETDFIGHPNGFLQLCMPLGGFGFMSDLLFFFAVRFAVSVC